MSITEPLYLGWRSLLFIPAHVDKFVDKAHTRGADAYILDLEDSVPLAEKELARSKVAAATEKVGCEGAAVLVRINLDDALASLDIPQVVVPGVSAIVVPKVESGQSLQHLSSQIAQAETANGVAPGQIKLIATIESVDALPKLDEIATADPRVIAMTLGSEDFSTSAGMEPIQATLLLPNQMLAFACRRAGIAPLGFPGSIADYSDMDAFRDSITLAKQFGFVGAFCIHPKQAQVLNQMLVPTDAEVAAARELIETYETGVAAGKGAVEFRGKMVDLPVVLKAKETLAKFELFNG